MIRTMSDNLLVGMQFLLTYGDNWTRLLAKQSTVLSFKGNEYLMESSFMYLYNHYRISNVD